MRYIILTGALKNVGDFLIADRAKKLIEKNKQGAEIIEMSRYEELDDKLDLINSSNALILAGGPGYTIDMYPNIFRLTNNINDIKIPIVCLGMGWYGKSNKDKIVYNYKYTNKSKKLLEKASNTTYLSCRDYLTSKTLKANGFDKNIMTGCPAWYDMEYVNKEYKIDSDIKKVIFSDPADMKNIAQAKAVMDLIKKKFLKAKFYCAFHRGLSKDVFSSRFNSNKMNSLKEYGEKLGFEIVDLSYNLDKMKIYDECDIHIGYRVHAHIYCISHFKKSILIEEDGRGTGVNEAMGLQNIEANRNLVNINTKNKYINKLLNNIFIDNKYVIKNLENYIDELEKNKYKNIETAFISIKNHYINMLELINSIP